MPDDVDLKSIRINRQSEAITLDAKKEDGISDDVDLKTIQPEIAKKVEVNKPVGDAKPKRKTTGLLSSDMLAKFNCA
ncbi:hypothetical protein L596_013118 [Steinernema carpocapsae]|uniref:Uncharacterized protein n=1 Tax=Steinernema carpocapsae TaxID=34508 RepID=A0A4U5NZV8_STECR|nr:hypothetical protein L596_013118 [Steinernema carpocapsae]